RLRPAPGKRQRVPEILEIRGEVFIPLREFERINDERQREGKELFMNPRNACAGTLKQLDPKIVARRRLGFFAHGRGLVSDDDFASSHTDFLAGIQALGVPVNPAAQRCDSIEEVLALIEAFANERLSVDYATDGMVVRLDSFELQGRL